jgi:DNA-directed RNA polymerase subunit E'/Rpb7
MCAVADPLTTLELKEGLVVRPGDLLVIRISPDQVRSEKEFHEFATQLKEAFEDRMPGQLPPLVIVADQLAVQQPT